MNMPRARCLAGLAGAIAWSVVLSEVTYIDSSGVASLVEGYQHAKSHNQRFGLIGVSEAAMNVLELARLDKVFPIFESLEECLAAP